jgi:gamma-glutamyl hercynylcysteine S-oxide synthase
VSEGRRPLDRGELALALLELRNHNLGLLAMLEGKTDEDALAKLSLDGLPSPLWLLGHVAWFQEYWIARNPLRQLGRSCPGTVDRAESLDARADAWWDDRRQESLDGRYKAVAPAEEVRAYLMATLEQTLALLDETPAEPDALHFFQLCLWHEARHAEDLLDTAQVLGLPMDCPWPSGGLSRPALVVPPTRWRLGVDPLVRSLSLDHERPAHEVSIPEFEVDAQPVTWGQFIEFVEDAAYERPELWHPDGLSWLQQGAPLADASTPLTRRAPRFVEQMGGASGAVLQRRFGQLVRVRGDQPVSHVSWWEADAWCRWAGRRLPAEVEWDLAAHTLSGRGFRWGEVLEWTGTSARPYPGFVPDAAQMNAIPAGVSHKVMRGASALTRPVLRRPSLRRFAAPGNSHQFSGFRSCAL